MTKSQVVGIISLARTTQHTFCDSSALHAAWRDSTEARGGEREKGQREGKKKGIWPLNSTP